MIGMNGILTTDSFIINGNPNGMGLPEWAPRAKPDRYVRI
ncbi:hypothetical protein FACS1894184_10650 [Clostridia bacterium]|nr:hypothetical protein FACS1894184_10650 [Clostridia bacterium]